MMHPVGATFRMHPRITVPEHSQAAAACKHLRERGGRGMKCRWGQTLRGFFQLPSAWPSPTMPTHSPMLVWSHVVEISSAPPPRSRAGTLYERDGEGHRDTSRLREACGHGGDMAQKACRQEDGLGRQATYLGRQATYLPAEVEWNTVGDRISGGGAVPQAATCISSPVSTTLAEVLVSHT